MNIQTLSTLMNFLERVPVTGTKEAQDLLICKQELTQNLQAAIEEQKNAGQAAANDKSTGTAGKRTGKK